MAIDVIKKKYPILDENGNPSTFPTFASQVFDDDGGEPIKNKLNRLSELYTNLADNSDFTRWVAQAGIGGMHGTQAYGGDRWILTDGSITGSENTDGDGYSNVTLNGTLVQVVPSPPAVATPFIEMVSGEATITYDASVGEIVITSVGGVIKNVLLLEGEWTTKPPYVPKGYAAELMECMRYYQIRDYVITVSQPINDDIVSGFNFMIPMRVNPTVTIYDGTGASGAVGAWTSSGITNGIVVSQIARATRWGIGYLVIATKQTVISRLLYKYEASADL